MPIVEEIPDRLYNLVSILKSKKHELSSDEKYEIGVITNLKSKREYQLDLIDSLNWLIQERSNYASIDTFAKKLTIRQNHRELEKLKIALSVFFMCEQCREKPDMRYDTFFASLINSGRLLPPDNIKILSWNYDYQFELAYSEYIDYYDISTIQEGLRIKSKYGYHQLDDGFEIYKLNGTVGLISSRDLKQYPYMSNLKVPFDMIFLDQIVKQYAILTNMNNFKSSLSFSWERERPNNSIADIASTAIKDTVVLIVIGYSFPFFNRDIDRKLIRSMSSLKKVYFQAPDAEIIKERFQAIRDDLDEKCLVPLKDTKQFLLPNEL